MKQISALFIAAALTLAVAGCGPKDPSAGEPSAAMGAKAPTFSGDLKKFVVGAWSPIEDGTLYAEKKWIFKEDGTFVYHGKAAWRVAGKWSINQTQVDLQYLTMDGVPWQKAYDTMKKGEEGGTQAGLAEALAMEKVYENLPKLAIIIVDEDKKHLAFSTGETDNSSAQSGSPAPDPGAAADPNATPSASTPDLGAMMKTMSTIQLERLE